ncbi:hypothetical protein FRB99_003755 [Tulasnella sp. 403]|nr:hypothetical protein FRB99_003755 [Tulasnella sp. 403]
MDLDDVVNNLAEQYGHPDARMLLPPPPVGRKLLDLVFIQDCTGSQGSYISSATKHIRDIFNAIFTSGRLEQPDDLRIGLIGFRDHPPQDHTWVLKNFGFSSDPSDIEEHLKTLYAAGGGDGPEAVTAALREGYEMPWRPTASKMIVLIADAPPHGIGEYGDGFPDGSPDGVDPLQLARAMAKQSITLFFVACEPALSGYQYATDFYRALVGITSGTMVPLTTANLLAHAIIGSVLENLDMQRLIEEVHQEMATRILGNNESIDDVARELQVKLQLRNEKSKRLVIENIYRPSEEASHNVDVWMHAANIASAKSLLKKVRGPRFTDKYLMASTSRRGNAHYTPYIGRPRPSAASAGSLPTPTSSPPGSAATSPSPRKIVSDFPAFGAAVAQTSVFGTAVQSGGQGLFPRPSAFEGIRDREPGGGLFDEDDEDDTSRQRIELREDSITFDQAKRIALQSAWRNLGT